jgi:hypothetical protein
MEIKNTPQTEQSIHTTALTSPTFRVTNDMLQMDETTRHMPLRELVQVDMVLSKIPTKALYR